MNKISKVAMAKVLVEVFSKEDNFIVPIETLITLFTLKYCEPNMHIILVKSVNTKNVEEFLVDLSCFRNYQLIEHCDLESICEFPFVQENTSSYVAGMCGTLRQIVKTVLSSDPENPCKALLGFKESCLLSCSESSVWTKFCEIDIIYAVNKISELDNNIYLPKVLARFEYHMSQPIKLHNTFKYTMSKKFNGHVPREEKMLPEHIYAEGPAMSLVDVIIFICIHLMFKKIDEQNMSTVLPFTFKWYNRILNDTNVEDCLRFLKIDLLSKVDLKLNYLLPDVEKRCLYRSSIKKCDFTKQDEVTNSLDEFNNLKIKFELDKVFSDDKFLDWSNIPVEATPEGGDLPASRLTRKIQQLENLCRPIIKLAKSKHRIVDFCSGGGHLGILVAYLLPQCNIILVENKPQSLMRAKQRAKKLFLNNVTFFQGNLDYFKGDFDIGTSLHACGVATDLVMKLCVSKKAAFVCCPCCYGSIQKCSEVTYPRSEYFYDLIDERSYMVIGHAADQTHDDKNSKTTQGYQCMLIIDTDRKMYAKENGYKVHLNKLQPESCSPKNHLIIGSYDEAIKNV